MNTYPLPRHAAEYLDAYPAVSISEMAAALDIGYASASVYRSRWRAQRQATAPEKVWGVTVTEVRITADGFEVRYQDHRDTIHEATLPAGEDLPTLRRGWYGNLTIWQGTVISVDEAA